MAGPGWQARQFRQKFVTRAFPASADFRKNLLILSGIDCFRILIE